MDWLVDDFKIPFFFFFGPFVSDPHVRDSLEPYSGPLPVFIENREVLKSRGKAVC